MKVLRLMAVLGEEDIRSMIPKSWRGLKVRTEEDLVYLGTENLRALIVFYNEMFTRAEFRINAVMDKVDFLKANSPHQICNWANETGVGLRAKMVDDIWLPADEKWLGAMCGATTLGVCGWCEYATPELKVGTCQVKSYCSVIPRDLGNGQDENGRASLCFNEPCLLTKQLSLGSVQEREAFLAKCIEHLGSEEEALLPWWEQKEQAEQYITYCLYLKKKAQQKPVFAELRTVKHFQLGAEVMWLSPEREWVAGEVVQEASHENESVTVCNKEGKMMRCLNMRDKGVMLKWEYAYLEAHENYWGVWMKMRVESEG